MTLIERIQEAERLDALEGEELRTWFKEFHLHALTEDQSQKVMSHITDEEIRELSMLWQFGDKEDQKAAEIKFREIMERPVVQ